jgi:hypothetical protein
MLCRVALVRIDVSEKLSATFIRVTRIGELGTTLAVTSNGRTLRRNFSCYWLKDCHILEKTILILSAYAFGRKASELFVCCNSLT